MTWPVNISVKADLTQPVNDISRVLISASEFVGKVVGPAFELGGSMLADQLGHWRAQNIERLRLKWLRRREQMGICDDAIRCLPYDIAHRFFEASANESDDEVQELWAGLLAAATSKDTKEDIKRVHIDILKSISGLEVRILKFLYLLPQARAGTIDLSSLRVAHAHAERDLQSVPVRDRAVAIQNLKRQQCVRRIPDSRYLEKIDEIEWVLAPGASVSKEDFKEVIYSLKRLIEDAAGVRDRSDFDNETGFPESVYELTDLGEDLMRACLAAETSSE
ncbi:Abi-alpha family protein [Pseudolabrys sp. FHR47]|uniref:Abi-alpha family protein n=1 Tax=Pseudolabrys sp. FHR47 TaxID=2562284 RepID=UPI0010BF2348|nr:Abi-alpha family protein [Pseudolabrys sp. FHR47]